MDVRMQKHRMIRWLGRLFVVLSLVTSWGAQAAIESVAPLTGGNTWYLVQWPVNHPFPSAEAACSDYLNLPQWAYWLVGVWVYVGTSPNADFYTSRGMMNCVFFDKSTGTNAVYSAAARYPGVCPVPTVNPLVPYAYKPTNGMCERTVPDQCLAPNVINTSGQCVPPEKLTITLYGGTTTEPGISLPFIAAVTNQDNQPPKNPVTVKISLKVDSTSGGHDHGTSDRPRGGIAGKSVCESDDTCWSQESPANNGAVVFNFNPTETSGKYTITATCDGCTNNPQTAEVNVKVAGLKPIPPSGLYALYETDGSVIGAVKNRHESNHYLTPIAANKLLVIAINYHHLNPTDPVLHVNDASLMWGGLFDRDADWDTPHEEHRRGSVVDIRANSKTGAIPAANFQSFIQSAKDRGVDARIHNPGETSQHFHVRLLNRSE